MVDTTAHEPHACDTPRTRPGATCAGLAEAREEDQRRLRQELHDRIGPVLSGARMAAHSARNRATEPRLRGLLDELCADLGGAAAELRRIVDDLQPAVPDGGLAATLRTVARRHRAGALAVDLRLPPDLAAIPADVAIVVGQVAEEALTNVARHAGAGRAILSVERLPGLLRVEVVDDGTGPGPRRPGGVGLDSMRRRCRDLGGEVTVEDARPGTRVRADLPLP